MRLWVEIVWHVLVYLLPNYWRMRPALLVVGLVSVLWQRGVVRMAVGMGAPAC